MHIRHAFCFSSQRLKRLQRNQEHLHFFGNSALFFCRKCRNQRRIHRNLAHVHGVVFARVLIGEKALHYKKFCRSPLNYLRMVNSAVFRCVKRISESRSACTERCNAHSAVFHMYFLSCQARFLHDFCISSKKVDLLKNKFDH